MRGLGLYLGLGLGNTQGGGIVSTVSWQLPFYLNLLATIGPDAVAGGTSVTNARVFDAILGLILVEEDAGKLVSEGERRTGAGVYVNDDGSGNKLHPTKELTENGVTSEVYLLYDYRQDSEAISIGDHRYLVGTTFNFALTATVGGTTHSVPPTIVQGDVGSTVAEDSGTVVWAVEYYSGIATETVNYLPRVLNHPAYTQFMVNPYGPPINQTIANLPINKYSVTVPLSAGTATIAAGTAVGTGFGVASFGSPLTLDITTAGTVTVTLAGAPLAVNIVSGEGISVGVDNPGTEGDGSTTDADATSFTVTPNPLPVNEFMMRFRVPDNITSLDESLTFFDAKLSNDDQTNIKYNKTLNRIILTKEVSASVKTAFSSATITVGSVVGISVSSTTGIKIAVNGVDGTNDATATADINTATTLAIGGSSGGTEQTNITDPTINTDMSDTDWYRETDWSTP